MTIGAVASCRVLPHGAQIGVGFGEARLTRDGETVWEETPGGEYDELLTVGEADDMASLEPLRDWRLVMYAPLWGRTWQRQSDGEWVEIDRNEGFA